MRTGLGGSPDAMASACAAARALLAADTPSAQRAALGVSAQRLLCTMPTVPPGSTVANTTAETAFPTQAAIPSGWGGATGSLLRLGLSGYFGTGAILPGSLRLRIKVGGQTLFDSGAYAVVVSLSSVAWRFDGEAVVTATGCRGSGRFAFSAAGLSVATVLVPDPGASVAVDWSADAPVTATAQWSAAQSANSVTLDHFNAAIVMPWGW